MTASMITEKCVETLLENKIASIPIIKASIKLNQKMKEMGGWTDFLEWVGWSIEGGSKVGGGVRMEDILSW